MHTTHSFIKDTTHFLNKLEHLEQLPQNAFLVTLDVSSLYTNIPHNEGIDAYRHFLNTRDHNASSISTETLCDLLRMILTMNNFSFNDKHYLQTHGTAMGTRMAPSYANLFLAKFEMDALSRAPFQPFLWWRYIDDIFMIWTRSVQDLNTFSSFNFSMTFTPPQNSHATISSLPYPFSTPTSYFTMAKSSRTFTPNLQTNANTYYIRHVIPYTPNVLFLSV